MYGAPLNAHQLGQLPGQIRSWIRKEKAAGRLIERRVHAEPGRSSKRRAVFMTVAQTIDMPLPAAQEMPAMSATDELLAALGDEADTVDNLISAEALPLPAHLAKEARVASLTALRDRLRALYVAHAGNNPWEIQP